MATVTTVPPPPLSSYCDPFGSVYGWINKLIAHTPAMLKRTPEEGRIRQVTEVVERQEKRCKKLKFVTLYLISR